MGLASKLAAAQGNAAPVANYGYSQGGAPPPQQQQQQQSSAAGQQGAGYPGKPQYQAYNPGGQGQAPPPPPPQQQSYGQQPPQGQYQPQAPSQYGGPGGQPPMDGRPPMNQSGTQDVAQYRSELQRAIQEKQLQSFYPPGSPAVEQIAARAGQEVDRLCQAWRIPKEIGNDIVRLALYDVIIYVDDSGSMQFEENGERIDDLKLILSRVAFAATLFDDDGIDVRFMNDDPPPQYTTGIKNEQQVTQLISGHKFKGLTPMGTMLRQKVIDGIVLPKLRSGQARKPFLVITITDGQPAGEQQGAVADTIRYAIGASESTRHGKNGVAFQFAQVGNDQKATEFLGKLDNDPQIGSDVDCTSNYENESAEMARAVPPVELTPDLWVLKLILGSIDPSYDTQDEKQQGAGGYGGPPPPGQGYGGQQGYGAPPPQQQGYGRPPPPQQGYGQPPQGQYGQPPQQQYNRPPPQSGYPGQNQGPPGGYGGQQGGYGAPPPPRY